MNPISLIHALRQTLLSAIVFAAALISGDPSHAACSSHVGKVVFNEVFQPNNGTRFVEIKVLDPSVKTATSNFQNWKIDLYAGNNGTKQQTDVSSGYSNTAVNSCGTTSLWIRFPSSVLSYLSSKTPPFNFVLYDSSNGGQIVDILRLGNDVTSFYGSGSTYGSCPTIEDQLPSTGSSDTQYDAQASSGGSVKDWYRNPDGTGPWGGQGTSNVGNSSCGNNVGTGGSYGVAKASTVSTVATGQNFTYTLYSVNGATAVSNPASVVITDDLNAAGLTFVSCTTSRGTCTHAAGIVTWTVGAVGANTSYTASLTVNSATAGVKTNTIVSNVGSSPPVSATAAPVTVLAPLADWRMDESSWNGTTSEVKDSSGNNNHGTAKIANGSTQPPSAISGTAAYTSVDGSQSTCNYGEFDRASGPTRSYTYVELPSIPALPSSFTFMAWIRSTNAGAQHQRILVRDDAQNGWGLSLADGTGQAKLRFFNRNIANSGTVSGQGTNPACGAFCLDTNAVITNNAWHFIAAAIDTTAKQVTLYVFDASGNLLAATSSAFSGTWQDGSGLAAIGGETAASSEGQQSSWHFLGNIDEVEIFSGVLSQPAIQGLMTRTRACAVIDHVELVHSGSGLTCTASPVTVLGCTSSASCYGVTANQTNGNVTLSPNTAAGAQWCSDALCASPITGSITVASGTTIYYRQPTAGTDTLAATASGANNSTAQCTNTTTGATDAAGACNHAIGASGFLVNAPNHYSCAPQTVTLQAVKSNATNTACIPAFNNVNRNISLYSSYTNPTTGTNTVSLNYVTSAGGATSTIGALSTNSASPSALSNLYFDNTGTATLNNFVYQDAGQITLYPNYAGSAATNDVGLTLAAVSGNSFIATPKSFSFSGIPAAPLTAGTPFNVTVTAKNACATPTTTPNFGHETTAASASLTSSNPTPGLGNALAINQSLTAFSNGQASTNLTWSEVGTVDLTATTAGYLGSTLNVTGTQTAVGRFKPAYFDTAVTQGCSSFTYSGQPFTATVTARAVGGTTTANYAGTTWAKLVTLADAGGGSLGTFTNSTIAADSFSAGIGSTNTIAYTFTNKSTPPTALSLRATDPDSVSSSGHTEESIALRSGAMRLSNAYGSELIKLPVPAYAQYWTSTGWQKNTADNCTQLTVPTSVNGGLLFSATTARNQLSDGETLATMSGSPAGRLDNGDARLSLSAPGEGNFGYVDIVAGELDIPAWLGTPNSIRACFGSCGPRSPVIFSRERY